MDTKETAKEILLLLNGVSNVESYTYSSTHLYFSLKNIHNINTVAIESIPGIREVIITGTKIEINFDPTALQIHKEMSKLLESKTLCLNHGFFSVVRRIIYMILNTISQICTPIVPAMVGAGLLKGILVLLLSFDLVSFESKIYQLLSIVADSIFYFLPVLVAFSSARKFNVNPYAASFTAGILLHPGTAEIVNNVEHIDLGDISVTPFSYAYTIVPIMLGVWLMSYIEKGLKRIIPQVVNTILLPICSSLLVVSFTLFLFEPAIAIAGTIAGEAYIFIYENYSWLAGILLGALYSLFQLTNVHTGFLPITIQSLSNFGLDYILAVVIAANSALAGGTLAVCFKTKDKKFRIVAGGAVLNAAVGIMEPALYGVMARLKRPLFAVIIAGAVGGLIMGIFKVGAIAIGTDFLAGLSLVEEPSLIYYLLGCIVSFVIALILTLVMRFEDIPAQDSNRIYTA